jgi:enoyl-CoA hydratase
VSLRKKGINVNAYSFLNVEIKNNICFATINRPESLNSLNRQVLKDLDSLCAFLEAQEKISILVLSGAGEKAFVAGADIKEMQNLSAKEAQEFSKYGQDVFSKLELLPQVTIARVAGFALGGGLELALSCDMIICTEKSVFGFPEVTLGLIPGFGGTQRLSRKIGLSHSVEWICSAAKYSATVAKELGLVGHVQPVSEIDNFISALCDKISKNGPQSVRLAKKTIHLGYNAPLSLGCALEAGHFGLCFSHPESKEGIAAFVEKRSPAFKTC